MTGGNWVDRGHAGGWETPHGSVLLWLVLPLLAAVALAVMAHATPDFYAAYMEPELGVLEMLHVLQNVVTALLAAILLARPEVRRVSWLAAWVALALAGSVYTAGEEASWGQHIFAWATPDTWQNLNDQGETNLHNVSSWFDQKPRLILEIGILVGALALPLLRGTRLYPRHPKLAYLIPSARCVPAAAVVALTRVEDVILDVTGGGLLIYHRSSEVQEFFMYWVVMIYVLDLLDRTRRHPPPA